jgi:hypothetical protein
LQLGPCTTKHDIQTLTIIPSVLLSCHCSHLVAVIAVTGLCGMLRGNNNHIVSFAVETWYRHPPIHRGFDIGVIPLRCGGSLQSTQICDTLMVHTLSHPVIIKAQELGRTCRPTGVQEFFDHSCALAV